MTQLIQHSLQLIGTTDPNEIIDIIIVLRRRHDCHPIMPLGDLMPRDDFVQAHGCHPTDLITVLAFLTQHQLTVASCNEASKQIKCSGKISDMELAFNVHILQYLYDGTLTVRKNDREPTLIEAIVSVIGLDNVPVDIRRNFNVNPGNTVPLSVKTMAQVYQWPPNSAGGQIVGIWHASALTNHNVSDLNAYFQGTGESFPTMINVLPPDGTVNGTEANLDICTVGSAAPGAIIANYYMSVSFGGSAFGIIDTLTRMVHPEPSDPNVSIITISYGFHTDITIGAGRNTDLNGATFHNAMTSVFQDAAAIGITVLGSTGDSGSGLFNNGIPYVELPSINPYCVAVGGTVIGNIQTDGVNHEEYIWNQDSLGGGNVGVATGGGVSQFYPVPTYQSDNNVHPVHVTTGLPGRGSPDIVGNASGFSGLRIFVDGTPQTVGGTSLTAPLYAGLIARINAFMGRRTGFLQPIIYANKTAFREINQNTNGPPSNATGGAPGYAAVTGWDGSSGLGMPIGTALQTAIINWTQPRLALSYADDGGTAVSLGQIADTTFQFNHPPMNQGNHFVNVFVTGQPSMTGVVNFTVNAPSQPQPVQNLSGTPSATSLLIDWAPPDLTASANSPPPWTYRLNWGTTTAVTNVINLGSVTNFTITGLTPGTTYFIRVDVIGPTNLVGLGGLGQIATVNPSVVPNISCFSFLTGGLRVNWDDVGANQYFMEYATSTAGPWHRAGSQANATTNTNAIPFTQTGGIKSGGGAVTAANAPQGWNGSQTTSNFFRQPCGAISGMRVALGTNTSLQYWVRIIADFGTSQTTSAPLGPTHVTDNVPPRLYHEPLSGDAWAQAISPGTIRAQWDDFFPNTLVGGGTITYHLLFFTDISGGFLNPILTTGPYSTGFGYGSSNFITVTGIPAGSYFIYIKTDPTGDSGNPENFPFCPLHGNISGTNIPIIITAPSGSLIGIDPIAAFVGSKFTLTGTLTSFTSAPELVYNDDNGANITINPGFVTKDNWFLLDHPAMSGGAHTFKVSVASTPSILAIQNYTVNPAYAPPAISSISAGNIDSSSIALSFLPPDSNQEYTYRVGVGTTGLGGPFPTTLNLPNTGLFGSVGITIQPLTPSTTYYFNIAGVAPGGLVGTFTATGPYQTTAAVAPNAPSIGVGQQVGVDLGLRFNVGQSQGTQPITYTVAWSTSSTGSFTNLPSQQTSVFDGSALIFNATGLAASSDYYYRVTAQNSAGTNTSGVQGPARTNNGNVIGLTTISQPADPAHAINVLFMAEGFTTAEQTTFNNACTTAMNNIQADADWGTQFNKFNFYRLNINSFNSSFTDLWNNSAASGQYYLYFTGQPGNSIASTIPAFVLGTAAFYKPNYSVAIVIANQNAGSIRPNSGTTQPTYLVIGRLDPAPTSHELGHALLGLGDEYGEKQGNYPGPEPVFPNVTMNTNRSSLKWGSLVLGSTPLPTGVNNNSCTGDVNYGSDTRVGLWEGGDHYFCRAYHPQTNCKMLTNFGPFCAVCRQTFNTRMNNL